ncbi:Peptide chain release factor 1-like, mitochondrial [Hypsibius exemplaris]|uniref:Peptide chain release factor 1-like, mitochondrial n=1 Tax=Hypsibius exemplaris TaxID=2072580 RepID=A0A9X6NCX0_HYPEX|nr:Peptide chain release factor 1-like, mitochondrial [Hypsibius exemplaris]
MILLLRPAIKASASASSLWSLFTRRTMTHAGTVPRELEIALPWGKIAAQEWKTPESKRQILMLHGWQDNSNTFKKLVPLLPSEWHMVAIDFPGHGLSSHRMQGLPYHGPDFVIDVKAAVNHLGWKNYSIIGHSMGAGIAQSVASCFPDEVQSLVCIDMIKPISAKADTSLQTLRRGVVAHLGYDPSKDRTYGRDEAVDRYFEATAYTLTRESVAVLLERGLKEVSPGQFKYTRDRRLQFPSLFRFTTEQHLDMMKDLKCDLMIIKAIDTPQFEKPEVEEEFLHLYAKNCRRFVFAKSEGTHHLHLNTPENVSTLIEDFLHLVPEVDGDTHAKNTSGKDDHTVLVADKDKIAQAVKSFKEDSSARINGEFQSLHQQLYGCAAAASAKHHTDTELLVQRYRRLQRAAPHIEVRQQKVADIIELEKLLDDATKMKDADMIEMVSLDLKKIRTELEHVEEQILDLMAPDEGTDISAIILEVNAGVGGQEAMLFAAELYQLYQGYAGFRGWSFRDLSYDTSDIGGIRSARAEICGAGSFRSMKFEGGVHRVQRVPKTEKFGRIQTSTTTVAVLPKPPDIDVILRKNELRIEICRSTGAGGQNVNKLDTAVRIVHLPTGAAVECQEEREQAENKKRAMERLAALLYQRQMDAQIEKQSSSRKIQTGSSARSDKIRTYNFPNDRLTDHRLNQNFHNLPELFRGQEGFHDLAEKLIREHKRETVEEMISAGEEVDKSTA